MRIAASFAVALATLSATAHAEPATAAKLAHADQLFAEAKALLGANLIQACDKFDQSLRENPAAIGTLLNVALCDEKLGRIASAVTKFTEARDRAVEQGLRQHVRAAEDHIAALTPDVPHLSIKLTAPVADTTVLIDDHVVDRDALDHVAVDPGERVIVVSAPTRMTYRATVVIGKAEHQDVRIPALAVAIVVRSSQRRIGQITTAAGGVALGAGIGLGLYARHMYQSQLGHQQPGDGRCDAAGHCEPSGLARTQRAQTLGNVGTVVGVVGAVATGVGIYFWYRAPREPGNATDTKLTVVPQLGADGVGIVAAGRF